MTLRSDLSGHFRTRRAALLRGVIQKISEGRESVSILDVGGRPQFWNTIGLDVLERAHARVTLLNITASEMAGSNLFEVAVGNACDLPYGPGQFDLVHSNSVIEHVGSWSNMKAFASETRRVGKNYFVQTPYFWFPIDPHFYAMPMFHWFPEPIQAGLLGALPIATAGRLAGIDECYEVLDHTRLLDGKRMHFLFPDADLHFEKLVGMKKSMTAVRVN